MIFSITCFYFDLSLFYVHGVMHKAIQLVERKFPTINDWKVEKLKERQANEVYNGEFGNGKIMPTLKDYFSQDSKS